MGQTRSCTTYVQLPVFPQVPNRTSPESEQDTNTRKKSSYQATEDAVTFTGDDTSWRDLKKIQKIDRMLTAMTKDQRREWLANNME